MEQIINSTVEALRGGKSILYPTDTIWGVGCDATNHDAIERLYSLKQRDHSKSMLILVTDSILQASRLQSIEIINNYLYDSRPTTFILPEKLWKSLLKIDIADNLQAMDGSLGLRIPKHGFCQSVIKQFGRPLVSTSANLSEHPSPQYYEDIEEELKQKVDYCVPPLKEFLSDETRGSRIVKLMENGEITIIRP